MRLYKLTKAEIKSKTYYHLRVPRDIAETYKSDQQFVIEKNDGGEIVVKPATITVA